MLLINYRVLFIMWQNENLDHLPTTWGPMYIGN
jgi:hypothetical protein